MKSFLVFIFLLFIQSQSFSAYKFSDKDNIFTLTFPDTWMEASKTDSDFLRKRIRSHYSTGRYNEFPIYAFHLKTNPRLFKCPYIMVTVIHPGPRCPDEALNDMRLLKKHLQLDIRDPNKFEVVKFDSNKNKFEAFDKHIFDTNKLIVWNGFSAKSKNLGWQKCIMALCLMDTGHIMIYCYSNEEEIDIYYDDFVSIINSIEIDDKHSYTPRLYAANSSWKNVLGKVLIGSIIGISIVGVILVSLIVLISVISRKKEGSR